MENVESRWSVMISLEDLSRPSVAHCMSIKGKTVIRDGSGLRHTLWIVDSEPGDTSSQGPMTRLLEILLELFQPYSLIQTRPHA